MKQSQRIIEAKSYLITSQPFIAVLLMELLKIVEVKDDPKCPHAATDGRNILLDTEWFETLSIAEATFVIAHEVLHVVYGHIKASKLYGERGLGPDFKKFSFTRMNKAQDFVINGTLVESKIGKMPLIGLHNPNIGSADQADDVYMQLPYEEDEPDGGSGFDNHLPAAAGQPSNGTVQRAVAAAANAAKAQGALPAGLARLVNEIIDPQQDWKEVLRDFMVTAMGHDQPTWSRLNRRKLAVAPHVAFPGTHGFRAGEVAIVVDTSGSISQEELTAFLGEIDGILQEAVPEECKLFWTDSKVAGIDDVDEFTDLLSLEPKGGGGTDMEAAFPVVAEEMENTSCVVVLTDMYTGFNESNEPAFPVLWVSTSKGNTAPYGTTIELEVVHEAA